MATKKAPVKPTKPTTKQPAKPSLQNLAARPTNFDDTVDEQMVDASGVFRVTSAIKQAQTGHDEEQGMRFANDSLVMRAQTDGFRETPGEDTIDESLVEDDTAAATKRQRLATLAARNEALSTRRRR
jgi:hypothetical protein